MKIFALAVAAASLVTACHSSQPLDVAANVDLKRFQGKWFEVASLPRDTQVGCTGTTAFYTLQGDGSIGIVNECRLGSLGGSVRAVTATALVPDPAVPAKLSLDFGGGYYGDYWILEVGANYEYAVVGHPTRQYLWILSRTPTLDPAKLGVAIAHAQAQSFDTSNLAYTTQQ